MALAACFGNARRALRFKGDGAIDGHPSNCGPELQVLAHHAPSGAAQAAAQFGRRHAGDRAADSQLSCDTPEKSGYAGGPVAAQRQLEICRQRLAGERAGAVFETLMERRLVREDGSRRARAIVPAGQLIDRYGRLLAYFAPSFRADELPPKRDPRRRTSNLEMVASGWAASFPIYPSLPSNPDFALLIGEAEIAWNRKRGAWDDFGRTLLAEVEHAADGVRVAFQRSGVDLRSRTDVGSLGFWAVPPPYRLWYWLQDAKQARIDLGLSA